MNVENSADARVLRGWIENIDNTITRCKDELRRHIGTEMFWERKGELDGLRNQREDMHKQLREWERKTLPK